MATTVSTQSRRSAPGWNGVMFVNVHITVPTVAAGTPTVGTMYEFEAARSGTIVSVAANGAGASTDFDVAFGETDTFDVSTTCHTISAVGTAGKRETATSPFINRDNESLMYVQVTNNDGSNATGIVTIDLIIKEGA